MNFEVFINWPNGKILKSYGGRVLGGIETKVGKSPYTFMQRLKDIWLDFNTKGDL